jgi:hypothetical protein
MESAQVNIATGSTNVRRAVRYFWQNYLLAKRGIGEEDVEVDILGGTFHAIRQPSVVLISEDLFSDENSNYEIFSNLTRKIGKHPVFFSKKKNDFALKNAVAARALYPNALILLLEADTSQGCNFSLIDPIKQFPNRDVVVATKVLKVALQSMLAN